jgi:hypothetical protein
MDGMEITKTIKKEEVNLQNQLNRAIKIEE